MAIGTDDTIHKFGTATSLASTSGAVLTTEFSQASDLNTFTNTADAPMASFVYIGTHASGPTNGRTVDLFLQPLAIDVGGTKDQNAPSAGQPVTHVGSFLLANVASEQVLQIDAALPNAKSGQQYQAFIRNNGSQSLNAGWDIQVTLKAYGPSA